VRDYKFKNTFTKTNSMNIRNLSFLIVLIAALTSWHCKSLKKINLFSIEDDKKLGLQVNNQIQSAGNEYPLLPERGNEEVYRYIRSITNNILNSGNVKHKDDFAWQVKIIDDPETLNAFATPGGYIYVYTGLIKFLDTEDQLAGVMGHEIAHADLRHSTRQMTSSYGVATLLSVATGSAEPGAVQQVLSGLTSLKFSRNHETEADTYSVNYLCNTKYDPAGAAGFFKKIAGSKGQPEFLSTHPSSEGRVKNIEAKAAAKTCKASTTNVAEHNRIKQLLR